MLHVDEIDPKSVQKSGGKQNPTAIYEKMPENKMERHLTQSLQPRQVKRKIKIKHINNKINNRIIYSIPQPRKKRKTAFRCFFFLYGNNFQS
ncbi:hypothetical protein KKC32_03095 [Patescibacteria group bacterium]|nr:hypothetical protein [Patescibacteria group bacterium]